MKRTLAILLTLAMLGTGMTALAEAPADEAVKEEVPAIEVVEDDETEDEEAEAPAETAEEEAAPEDESAPAETEAPAEEEAPAATEVPAEEESVVEDEAPAEEEELTGKEAIEKALDLRNMDQSWSYDSENDAWTLSIVTAVTQPVIEDEEGVSVCVPGAYVRGIDTDGDGEPDLVASDYTETVSGSLVIDDETSVTSSHGQVYTAATAPVILNTGAAGYGNATNTLASATYAREGYINVACGNRGKQDSYTDEDGNTVYTGDAPSCLADQKAAARFVKYNILLGNLPGSVDYWVSTGGSGGGAHAVMFAATSNHPDFYDYQIAVGAVGVYQNEDGSYDTTVSIDGEDVEISDGAWGCVGYSPITSLYEADMAMAFEYALDPEYSFNTPFQKELAKALALEYKDYINGQNMIFHNFLGHVPAKIEYDEETGEFSGSYVEQYLEWFKLQLQDYVDQLDYAQGWTWFDENGEALSNEAFAAMTSADKVDAFLHGRYDKGSTGRGGFGGPGGPGGRGGRPDFADGEGPMGRPDGAAAAEEAPEAPTEEAPVEEAPADETSENEVFEPVHEEIEMDEDGNVPLGAIDGDDEIFEDVDEADDTAEAPEAEATPEPEATEEPAPTDEPAAAEEGEDPNEHAGLVHTEGSGDELVVGTPDQGTTQASGSTVDSNNYATYNDMLAAYQADIAQIEAGDAYGKNIVNLYNPLNYIGAEGTENPAWMMFVCGAAEGDISMLNSMNLETAAINAGIDAFAEWQWDGGHVPSEIFGNSLALRVDEMYGNYAKDAQVPGDGIFKLDDDRQTENGTAESATGTDISEWVTIDENGYVTFDLAHIAAYRTGNASKATPGFDVIDYGQEDYVFGNADVDARHWSRFVYNALYDYRYTLEPLFNQSAEQ